MWICGKCNSTNDDRSITCPNCGAARSAGRFTANSASSAHNTAACVMPQQPMIPSNASDGQPSRNVFSQPADYYADFSNVHAGRGFMILGIIIAILSALLTLLLAWRQYRVISAAVLGLFFSDLTAVADWIKLAIYIPLSLISAAIAALPGLWTVGLGKALHRLNRMEELL